MSEHYETLKVKYNASPCGCCDVLAVPKVKHIRKEREVCRQVFDSKDADRLAACWNALSGVRNPEAVGRLIEAARLQADAHYHARGICQCSVCTAFRELEMETKP